MNTEQSLSLDIRYALCRAARSSLGVYPQATVDAEGIRTQRTEWQEGWNAAGMAVLDAERALRAWFLALAEPSRALAEELITKRVIDLYLDSGAVSMAVNCNDVFAWGCADAEYLTVADLPDLHAAWNSDSIDLWVCRRRGMQPQKPIVDSMKAAGTWTPEMEALSPNPYDAACSDCSIHGTVVSALEQEK